MKKLLIFLLSLAMLLAMSVPVLAYSTYGDSYGAIYDNTDQLDSDICQAGANRLEALAEEYQIQFRIDIVEDLENHEIYDYAELFYNQYEYGYGESKNCILLMLHLSVGQTSLNLNDYQVYWGGADADTLETLASFIDLEITDYVDSTAWEGSLSSDNEVFEGLVSAYAEAIDFYFMEEAAEGSGNDEAPTFYIYDFPCILTDGELEALEEQAGRIADTYDCCVSVLVAEDYREFADSMESLCDQFYNTVADNTGCEDAILLVLSMDERDYWLKDYGELPKRAVTDYGHEQLKEAFLDNFKQDDWHGGFGDFLSRAEEILEAEKNGQPLDKPLMERILPAYGIGLVIAAILAFIICGVFKAQMKTAVKATSADTYVTPDGVNIHTRQDVYTHTTRIRRKIEKSSSSGSSGGGNHSSGGKF